MKRRKTIRAGRLVYDIAYTVPRPNATPQERKRIREVTAEQIARTRCNTAQRKLELLMAANFEPEDLVITATYRDEDSRPARTSPGGSSARCLSSCAPTAKRAACRLSSTFMCWKGGTATTGRTRISS